VWGQVLEQGSSTQKIADECSVSALEDIESWWPVESFKRGGSGGSAADGALASWLHGLDCCLSHGPWRLQRRMWGQVVSSRFWD
jgi:hypothetical protein